MTRKEVMAAIDQAEKEGAFDRHVDPIPREIVIPVDENYHYVGHRTFLEGLKYRLYKFFVVWPATWYLNTFVLKTRYVGRENLKGLKAAVLTCNHVDKFDCLAIKYGARGHRTFTVAADFNNMKGFLGEMMRAGDMLPLNTTMKGRILFSRVVEEVLTKRKQFLMVYPEASMWWHYEKPRPYKDGAFSFAAKYDVPVVPQFITYRDLPKTDAEGIPFKAFTVHIGKPIYPDPAKTKKENIAALREQSFAFCKGVYEKVYGKKLTYTYDKEANYG